MQALQDDRALNFVVEKVALEDLEPPAATPEWLDQLVRSDAPGVMLGGVDRAERVEGFPGRMYCYFPPVDVGPYRAQLRLTCEFCPTALGRVDVNVLELNPGILDRTTGKVEYQADPKQLIDATSTVEMTWRPLASGSGLRVIQRAVQRFTLKIPWWFPVPDPITQAALRPFISQAIVSSQAGVVRGLRQRLARLRQSVAA